MTDRMHDGQDLPPQDVGGGGNDGGPRRVPTPASAGGMGDSVTPHALFTNNGDFRFLICGIDTLDLGLYVNWGVKLANFQPQLEYLREKALKGETAIWRHYLAREAVVRPSGKRNYRYHLQFPDLNLWIANVDEPNGFPNVYASPTAKALWTQGPASVVESIARLVWDLGGDVMETQVSRCDLAADFYMEQAPTLEFLRSHLVSRSRAVRPWEDRGLLETFYVGKKGAPIQARIYDKLLLVMRKPETVFFAALWGGLIPAWRVEFQLKRSTLKDFKIESFDDLQAKAGGLWTYLTSKWMSLRLPGESNTSRRPVHPWWEAVQDLAEFFGPSCELSRDLTDRGGPQISDSRLRWTGPVI